MVAVRFAIFVGIIALFMIVSTIMQFSRKKITTSWAVFWCSLWVLGSVAVIFSGWIDQIGNYVIHDEGSKLVIYVAIIVLFYICYRLFLAIQRLNDAISRLIEELAKKK